jgi:hypothetical protein
MSEDFEQSITRGKAHWIASVVHEPASSRLVILFSDNEDSSTPTRAVEFFDIRQLESRWTDQREGWLEGLLGAHEEELADGIRYRLVTDQREIGMIAGRKAVVHPGSAAYAASG